MQPIAIYYKKHPDEVKEIIRSNTIEKNREILVEAIAENKIGLLHLALSAMPKDHISLDRLFKVLTTYKRYNCLEMMLCDYRPTESIVNMLARDPECTETPFKIFRNWEVPLNYTSLAFRAVEGGDSDYQIRKIHFFIMSGRININETQLFNRAMLQKSIGMVRYLTWMGADSTPLDGNGLVNGPRPLVEGTIGAMEPFRKFCFRGCTGRVKNFSTPVLPRKSK